MLKAIMIEGQNRLKLKRLSLKKGVSESLLLGELLDEALKDNLQDVLSVGKQKGFAVRELAEALHVTKDTLYKWSRGDIVSCSVKAKAMISIVLGMKI